jgi:hypothetical protein
MADRETTEKLILDKLEEIRQIILEYNPDETYLDMTISKSKDGNGNDDGNWDCWCLRANNRFWEGGPKIDRGGWIDIGGEKWDKCRHEPGDRPGKCSWRET